MNTPSTPSTPPSPPMPHDDAGPRELVVYGGRTCCLCDDAMAQLEVLAPRLGLAVRHVYVDGDPALEAAYRAELPVGFLGGRKVFKYHVDADLLARRAAAATASGQGPTRW